jgi:hypothetical protein
MARWLIRIRPLPGSSAARRRRAAPAFGTSDGAAQLLMSANQVFSISLTTEPGIGM